MTEATPEMRAAVARDECRAHGHSFSYLNTMSSMAPQLVLCTRCDAGWRIHPDDINENWGTS